MSSFFERIKKRKLYQQWTNQSGLPEEEIPKDLQQSESLVEDIPVENDGVANVRDINGFSIRLRLRHLFILLLIFTFLIIITSILATVLVMQSC